MSTSAFDVNRERVIQIAAGLFAKKGYHGTGIAELGATAGLGRGALYHYIESKEALLYAISKNQIDVVNLHAEKALSANLGAEDLLREMARGLLRNITEHQAEWAVFFRDHGALTGERRDRVIVARERYESYWRQALDRGVTAGALRPMPRLLVRGILGMFNSTCLWFEPNGETTAEALADEFLDALLYGIHNPRGAAVPRSCLA
jgi:AcrR family transcriptional regulator